MDTSAPVRAVVGPTAAGKSDLAIAVAGELGLAGSPVEVVNADSMQLYRGMDIGTAKLTVDERRGVRHHLLDVLDVRDPATVAEFQDWARDAVAACHGRGVLPLLVGGSALYVRAVLDDFEFPGTDPSLRARLESDLVEVGPEAMHVRLAGEDPAAAEAILPSNGRRIVRALEVVALTGRPYAAGLPELRYVYDDVAVVGVDVPREVLDARIEARVDAMFDAGLVEEVERLAAQGLAEGRTASRALGYAQVLDAIAGRTTMEQARDETVRRTRKFARRQDSWFRKDPRITWVSHDDPDLVHRAVALLAP
ncbi:tRNA (adenosine(37)-N6)-dimethylallyltransferase MiaA [Solicola sp. PLA-1-18]|uniref:tRNA (adenosine(37)-N6)-dimethylallyltransferase MiaA n=1 Tax=Solicola sp. PLA-1-18 TaxID=3380532 RepID=UPI003B7DEAB6